MNKKKVDVLKKKNIAPSQEIINFDIAPQKPAPSIQGDSKYKIDGAGIGKKKRDRAIIINKAIKLILILMCLYIVFLIIGVISTDYYIDENNKRQAVIAKIDTLEKRDDYKTLSSYITQIREIMVDITIIDIKVSNGDITYAQAANQYTNILDDNVDSLIPKIKVLNVQPEQELLKQNLQVILANDIGYYLQLMPKALLANNETDVSNALVWKQSMMQTYSSIDEGIRDLASSIKKEDDEFLKWNLEKAVIEKDSTAVLKQQEEDVPFAGSDRNVGSSDQEKESVN